MKNIEKLEKALISAAREHHQCVQTARQLNKEGQSFKADMTVMDGDFAINDRTNFAARLLTIRTRKGEIESFEKRNGIEIDVMIYDIPAQGSLDEWWSFVNDETAIVVQPSWRLPS